MEESKAGGVVSGSDKVRPSKGRKTKRPTAAFKMALKHQERIRQRIKDIDMKVLELRCEQRGLELALTIVESGLNGIR